jgi:hypothetical protein
MASRVIVYLSILSSLRTYRMHCMVDTCAIIWSHFACAETTSARTFEGLKRAWSLVRLGGCRRPPLATLCELELLVMSRDLGVNAKPFVLGLGAPTLAILCRRRSACGMTRPGVPQDCPALLSHPAGLQTGIGRCFQTSPDSHRLPHSVPEAALGRGTPSSADSRGAQRRRRSTLSRGSPLTLLRLIPLRIRVRDWMPTHVG